MRGMNLGWGRSLSAALIAAVVTLSATSCKPKAPGDAPQTGTDTTSVDPAKAPEPPSFDQTLSENQQGSFAAYHFRNFFLRPIGPMPPEKVDAQPLALIASKLVENYEATAHETGETPLALEIDLSQVNPAVSVRFRCPRMPVADCVALLAAAADCEIIGSGPKFQLKPIPDEGKRKTRAVELGHLDFSIQPNWSKIENLDALVPVSRPTTPQTKDANLAEALQSFGLNALPGTSLHKKPGDQAGWIITLPDATAADEHRVRTYVQLITAGENYGSYRVAAKLISLPPDVSWPNAGIPDDREAEDTLQQLSTQTGVTALSFPEFTAQYGQFTTSIIPAKTTPSPTPAIRLLYACQPLGFGIEDHFQIPGRLPISATSRSPQASTQSIVVKDKAGDTHVFLRSALRVDSKGHPIPVQTP